MAIVIIVNKKEVTNTYQIKKSTCQKKEEVTKLLCIKYTNAKTTQRALLIVAQKHERLQTSITILLIPLGHPPCPPILSSLPLSQLNNNKNLPHPLYFSFTHSNTPKKQSSDQVLHPHYLHTPCSALFINNHHSTLESSYTHTHTHKIQTHQKSNLLTKLSNFHSHHFARILICTHHLHHHSLTHTHINTP